MKTSPVWRILPLILLLSLSACKKSQDGQPSTEQPASAATTQTTTASAVPAQQGAPAPSAQGPDLTADSSGLSKATVVMKTAKGTMKFKFYTKEAPNTVKRFVELAQQKFFDGQSFHRVVPGFVVQKGDPKSRNKSDPTVGTGGSGQRLKAEFNSRKHVRGTVAMARAADVDSADSQFYVTLSAFPHLDEKYTVFGQVVDFGEKVGDKDVLDRIAQGDDLISVHVE